MKSIRITRKLSKEYSQFYDSLKNDLNGLILYLNNDLSVVYQNKIDNIKDGFVLTFSDDQIYNIYFHVSKESEYYDIVDIIPEDYKITIYGYRDIIDKAFLYIKPISKSNVFWSVKAINDYKSINSIISSKIAREQIIYALRNYPDIDKSSEIQKIDQLISYLYRYSRKKIEIDRLYEYLKKIRGIETEQSIKICERVTIGLNVLDVYNRKY